jgi:hypothetical protein
MIKVKIFEQRSAPILEEKIQDFLKENNVQVISHSTCVNTNINTFLFSIMYKEININDSSVGESKSLLTEGLGVTSIGNVVTTTTMSNIYGKPVKNCLKCPNTFYFNNNVCGEDLWDSEPNIILTSNPGQKKVHCEKCGYKGTRFV